MLQEHLLSARASVTGWWWRPAGFQTQAGRMSQGRVTDVVWVTLLMFSSHPSQSPAMTPFPLSEPGVAKCLMSFSQHRSARWNNSEPIVPWLQLLEAKRDSQTGTQRFWWQNLRTPVYKKGNSSPFFLQDLRWTPVGVIENTIISKHFCTQDDRMSKAATPDCFSLYPSRLNSPDFKDHFNYVAVNVVFILRAPLKPQSVRWTLCCVRLVHSRYASPAASFSSLTLAALSFICY